jgi:hypothetical protein
MARAVVLRLPGEPENSQAAALNLQNTPVVLAPTIGEVSLY